MEAPKRPGSVLIVAVILMIFGIGEVWVGWTGNYLNILSSRLPPSPATAVVGLFYILAGVALLVTRRKWGTALSLLFIAAEILGRAYLVLVGIAPHSGKDFAKIVIGGMIAAGFMWFIAARSDWRT